jgi:DHA1 family bicyclomycin/chloramphenicol resistance-like MFS transporter
LGIIFPNATAIAMQPFAAEAGIASALLGVFQFILGAIGGALVGAFHDGTALPMAIQIACYSLAARAILLLTPKRTATEALEEAGNRPFPNRPAPGYDAA